MRVPAVVLSLALVAGAASAAPRGIERDFERGRHVLLRASAPLTEADRAQLAEKGIIVQRVATEGRYLAHIARNAESDPRVLALEPLTAESKIQPSAYREAARGGAWAAINIYFHDDVSLDGARTAILASGGALEDAFATEFAPMRQLTAKIAPQSLAALAADDRVLMISGVRHFEITTHNATSAAISHVTELQTAPYGLTGAGVAVSLFELAEGQASHVEFGGRLNVFSTGGSSGNKAHATHTAGTIGAAGVRSDAKGMAPAATIYEFCVEDPSNTCTTKWITEKDKKLAPLGVVADNNSWGFVIAWSAAVAGYVVWDDNAEYFGAYDYEFSAPLDQISRDRNVLFVHSAGNEADDGPGGLWGEHRHRDPVTRAVITTEVYCYSKDFSGTDCPSPCTTGRCETTHHHGLAPFDTLSMTGAAKNVIAVGAVDTSREILGLSSRGPAKDGRVKPDVVARGANVLSSVPTNSYATNNGTSMAAPVVTGIAALITEQWRRTFVKTPKPEELKALIIAGADDLGNPGPDYTFGFGLADAKRSVDLILADHADNNHIRSTSIGQGQQYEMPIVVDSAQNVRVVLQWPDPPVFLPESEVSTANALVNNLDLEVVGPTGTLFLPYVLDKANPNAPATRGVNGVDNTEEVEIANASPGAYRIVVNGTAVPQGPQAAIIVTTARGARPCRDIQEPDNSADSAWGNIVPDSKIAGGICTAGDVDFYKFLVTKSSAMSVDVTAGDTPLRVTLSSNQVNATIEVPAYASRTLQAGSVVPQTNVTLKFEATSALGVEPDYTFTPHFGQDPGVRRRSARH